MAAPANWRPNSASTLVSIPLVDADFDDDNGQVEVRFETEILGDISVGAVAFPVTILAAI
jgi:hypothetical protein